MRRRRYRKFLKDGIIGYIQRIIITVLVTLAFSFILGILLKTEFKTVLKFSTFAVLVIGALSVLGGTNTLYSGKQNYVKATTRMTSATKYDIELLKDSYGFCIFMGISAGILYLIYLIL